MITSPAKTTAGSEAQLPARLDRASRRRLSIPPSTRGCARSSLLPSRPRKNEPNTARQDGEERIPEAGIRGASQQLELPSPAEGFDRLFLVRMDGKGGFTVEEWEFEKAGANPKTGQATKARCRRILTDTAGREKCAGDGWPGSGGSGAPVALRRVGHRGAKARKRHSQPATRARLWQPQRWQLF